jgi:hypothetical protein
VAVGAGLRRGYRLVDCSPSTARERAVRLGAASRRWHADRVFAVVGLQVRKQGQGINCGDRPGVAERSGSPCLRKSLAPVMGPAELVCSCSHPSFCRPRRDRLEPNGRDLGLRERDLVLGGFLYPPIPPSALGAFSLFRGFARWLGDLPSSVPLIKVLLRGYCWARCSWGESNHHPFHPAAPGQGLASLVRADFLGDYR